MIRLRRRKTQPSKPVQYQVDYVGLLENIFSSINASIAYLDLDLNIVRVNEAFSRAAEHPAEYFIGKKYFDFFNPTPNQEIFHKVAQTGEPAFSAMTSYSSPERGETYWSWNLQLIKRVDGTGIGLLLIAADITETIKNQAALKESQAQLEHLFESDPDSNILIDENGKILSLNQQAEIDFGYTRDELVGKSIEVLLPPRSRARGNGSGLIANAYPQKQLMGFREEIWGRRKDGVRFPVEVIMSPLQSENGIIVLAVVRDITQRKQMEREIAEVQHRLIESVENERLSLAQDLHDGPVQDLYGVVYMLQGLESELYGRSSQVELTTTRETTNQVINTLRDICANLRPAALAPFGLNRAIASHAEHFQASHPDLRLHMELDEDGTSLPESIRLALYRIYQHLISNVARHAHAKNAWIRFSMEDNQVSLEVQDDGVGFQAPSRYVELVRQGHYGLAGATERAEAIGGSVEFVTEPGRGSLVRVVVPVSGILPSTVQFPVASDR